MAKFNFFVVLSALFLVVSTARPVNLVIQDDITRSGFPDEGLDEVWISPSPGYDGEYIEDIEDGLDISPSPPVEDEVVEFEQYVEECARVIGEECGYQIFYAIFEDKSLNATCCDRLVQAGLGCSDALVKSALQFPEITDPDIYKAYDKSAQVFNKCANVGGDAASPSVFSA